MTENLSLFWMRGMEGMILAIWGTDIWKKYSLKDSSESRGDFGKESEYQGHIYA